MIRQLQYKLNTDNSLSFCELCLQSDLFLNTGTTLSKLFSFCKLAMERKSGKFEFVNVSSAKESVCLFTNFVYATILFAPIHCLIDVHHVSFFVIIECS